MTLSWSLKLIWHGVKHLHTCSSCVRYWYNLWCGPLMMTLNANVFWKFNIRAYSKNAFAIKILKSHQRTCVTYVAFQSLNRLISPCNLYWTNFQGLKFRALCYSQRVQRPVYMYGQMASVWLLNYEHWSTIPCDSFGPLAVDQMWHNQVNAHTWPKGFHVAFESYKWTRTSLKIRFRQNMRLVGSQKSPLITISVVREE